MASASPSTAASSSPFDGPSPALIPPPIPQTRSTSRTGFFSKAGSSLSRSSSKRYRTVTPTSGTPPPSSGSNNPPPLPVSTSLTSSSPSGFGQQAQNPPPLLRSQTEPPERPQTGLRKPSNISVPSISPADTTPPTPALLSQLSGTAMGKNGTVMGFETSPATYGGGQAIPPATASGMNNAGGSIEIVLYQHIHDMASKRISTLDYLRKAHEGRVYWFNTVHFSKTDLSRLPYFDTRKLSRRATNYLLLGLSIPTVLDLNSNTPLEYLRALSALLSEFETYQSIHPPDGSTSGSGLSRARIPQMFKRATHHATGTKGRRASSATEIGLPMGTSDPSDLKSMSSSLDSGSVLSTSLSNTTSNPLTTTTTSSSSHTQPSIPLPLLSETPDLLLPGEEYTYLLTPNLPFEPSYHETYTTLLDVLIDAYTRIVSMIASPSVCTPLVGEAFGKADGKVRKILIGGVVREFEEASRAGARAEVAGVGKVVLAGLMG